MHYFLIERLMGLFWVLVQQFCFVCIKYAHDDIVRGDGGIRRLAGLQIAFLGVLSAFCFGRELGLPFFSQFLQLRHADYFPWAVRIAICSAMILFDSLLVLYFWRIVRVYRRGLQAARPTLPGDLAVAGLVILLGCGYVMAGVGAAEAFGFHIRQYMWIGRFFIQISNFFYIALEVGGAVLFFLFLRRLQRGRRGQPGERTADRA